MTGRPVWRRTSSRIFSSEPPWILPEKFTMSGVISCVMASTRGVLPSLAHGATCTPSCVDQLELVPCAVAMRSTAKS